MSVPVLTGVGHEVDRSVVDEVAHTACKTPTACAQILVDQVRGSCSNSITPRNGSGRALGPVQRLPRASSTRRPAG